MDVRNWLRKNIRKKVHWDLCKKNDLEHPKKLYDHVPKGAVENKEVKVMWDINVQCSNMIEEKKVRHNFS